jgi:DcaP outer membrane protein
LLFFASMLVLSLSIGAHAQSPRFAPVVAPESTAAKGAKDAGEARLEVSGKTQLDFIQDFNRVDPAWNATLRPSTIPVTCPGDPGCGKSGESIFSIRQTAIAFKGFVPTELGQLKTDISVDLFGVGQGGSSSSTSFRLLHAWGEIGMFGVGQNESLFMNLDAFPNVLDYWGPSGNVFVRNPQIRFTPLNAGGNKLAVSLESPNAAIDTGKFSVSDAASGIRGRSAWPDIVGRYTLEGKKGQVSGAGILRAIGYENTLTADNSPSGTKMGWGGNVNGWWNVVGKSRIIGHIVYGEGIASYMNDGGVDLAPSTGTPGTAKAETVPSLGWYVYYDQYWSEKLASSFGTSAHHQSNRGGQLDTAFKQGSYASANIMWYAAKNVMTGGELLWGKLEHKDGSTGYDRRIQLTAQFKF